MCSPRPSRPQSLDPKSSHATAGHLLYLNQHVSFPTTLGSIFPILLIPQYPNYRYKPCLVVTHTHKAQSPGILLGHVLNTLCVRTVHSTFCRPWTTHPNQYSPMEFFIPVLPHRPSISALPIHGLSTPTSSYRLSNPCPPPWVVSSPSM